MEILLLRNPSISLGCKLKEGETGNVSKELGGRLVALGIAVEIERELKPKKASAPLKGVSPKPSVADAKPAEIAGVDKNEPRPTKESAE
jgi:hypothetical protein